MNLSLWINNKEFRLSLVEQVKNHILVSLDSAKHRVSVEFLSEDEILLNIDGKVYDVLISANAVSFSVCVNGKSFTVEKKSLAQILGGMDRQKKRIDIKTSMPGRIVKILAGVGERVREGQAVLILEAMKMQNEIKSPQSGTVTQMLPKSGESVEANALLFTIE